MWRAAVRVGQPCLLHPNPSEVWSWLGFEPVARLWHTALPDHGLPHLTEPWGIPRPCDHPSLIYSLPSSEVLRPTHSPPGPSTAFSPQRGCSLVSIASPLVWGGGDWGRSGTGYGEKPPLSFRQRDIKYKMTHTHTHTPLWRCRRWR